VLRGTGVDLYLAVTDFSGTQVFDRPLGAFTPLGAAVSVPFHAQEVSTAFEVWMFGTPALAWIEVAADGQQQLALDVFRR
jgi:hypothetical protein